MLYITTRQSLYWVRNTVVGIRRSLMVTTGGKETEHYKIMKYHVKISTIAPTNTSAAVDEKLTRIRIRKFNLYYI